MISVFLLSWNHEKYIEQSVQSIIDQTFRDLEIIYVDNNSSDRSFEIVSERLQGSGIPFKAFKRDRHYNIAANHNFAFSKCAGDFFCAISADDWIHQDNLKEKMLVFDKQPGVGLVYSGGYKYYDDIDIYEPFKVIVFPDERALEELLKRNFISALSCLIKMSVLKDVGLWNEEYEIEDGDLWVRILSKYRIVGLDKYLFFYRKHANAFSSDPEKMLRAKMQWLESNKHLNKHPQITFRNNIDHYLANKIMQETSLLVTGKILSHFRFSRMYFVMLIKSLLPLSWKKSMYKRSLVRKFGHCKPV